MALIGVGAAVILSQVAVVLRAAPRGVVHQLRARHRLAQRVEAVDADAVPLAQVERHLQAVVVRVLIGIEQQDRAERGIRPPRQDVRARRRRGGRDDWIVDVALERQIAGERPDVAGADRERLRELALHADIRLIGARPVEVERHAEDAATARVRAVVGERRPAHEIVVRVAQRGAVRHAGRIRRRTDVRERETRAPRLEVGHRVPLVARDAAVENAAGRADRRLAVAEGIPDEADTWRDVTEGRRNHAALDARITVEQLSGRRGRP